MVSALSPTQGDFFPPALMLSSDLATLHPLREQHMQMFSSALFWICIEFKIFFWEGGGDDLGSLLSFDSGSLDNPIDVLSVVIVFWGERLLWCGWRGGKGVF